MPLYEYECSDRHLTEARRGFDVSEIVCLHKHCGKPAQRVAVYRNQYLQGGPTTGPSGPPPEERDYRRDFREFTEASDEVDYEYKKAEEEIGAPIKRPNLLEKAKKRHRAAFREGQIQERMKEKAG